MSLIGGPIEDLPPILKTSYWESTSGSEENWDEGIEISHMHSLPTSQHPVTERALCSQGGALCHPSCYRSPTSSHWASLWSVCNLNPNRCRVPQIQPLSSCPSELIFVKKIVMQREEEMEMRSCVMASVFRVGQETPPPLSLGTSRTNQFGFCFWK